MRLRFTAMAVVAVAAAALALGTTESSASGIAQAALAVPHALPGQPEAPVVEVARRRYSGPVRRRSNTGRNVAIGVGAAILGGIIASEAARASPRNSCQRLDYDCSRGSRQACRSLYRYC